MKIAICGKMCSGKTTLAKKLMLDNPLLVHKSIASKVKAIAIELYGMKEEPTKKDRWLLQQIGTRLREIDPDVWINAIVNSPDEHVVVDDLRYENEARVLKEHGWVIIRLDVTPEEQRARIIRTYPDTYEKHLELLTHESEMQLDNLTPYVDKVFPTGDDGKGNGTHISL